MGYESTPPKDSFEAKNRDFTAYRPFLPRKVPFRGALCTIGEWNSYERLLFLGRFVYGKAFHHTAGVSVGTVHRAKMSRQECL